MMQRISALLLASFLVGCQTPKNSFQLAYAAGDLELAEREVDASLEKKLEVETIAASYSRTLDLAQDGAFLHGLDKGMVRLAHGDPDGARTWLEASRVELDRHYRNDIDDLIKAILVDDRSMKYRGRDYEHILVRSMLAMCELVRGGVDSYAYSLMIGRKQSQILGSNLGESFGYEPRKQYQRIGFGLYLEGVVLEAHQSSDTPLIFERADEFTGQQIQLIADARQRVAEGSHHDPGNGVVHIFYLAGAGPRLVNGTSPPTELSNRIASAILAVLNESVVPLAQDAVPVPVVEVVDAAPGSLSITSPTGELAVQTETILDVNSIVAQQVEVGRPYELARAVVRRALRAQAAEEVDEAAGAGGVLGVLGLAGTTALEEADTRCWSSLPASVQAARFELAAGEQELEFSDGSRSTLQVTEGQETYIVVIRPNLSRPATVLVDQYSQPLPLTEELTTTGD